MTAPALPPLRSQRGAARVQAAFDLISTSSAEILGACMANAQATLPLLPLPAPRVQVLQRPSRIRPAARGRAVAGQITLFPAAFADPYTLAWTLLHELAHTAGMDEEQAEAFAAAQLSPPSERTDA